VLDLDTRMFAVRLGPPRRRRIHLLHAKGVVLSPEGDVLDADPDWMPFIPNALADEGELDLLNVYLREQAHKTKYLCLLGGTPSDTTTMATMTEAQTPGSGGYARQQVLAADWSAPGLVGGDEQTAAAQKTFGPNSGATWAFSYVGLVTTATGTAGLFLSYVATSAARSIDSGMSYLVTFKQTAS
jgi:hypothetical protein